MLLILTKFQKKMFVSNLNSTIFEQVIANLNIFLMTIGTKIKQLRDKKQMSQNVLATKLGIGQTTLGNIESGDTKKVDFLLMDKICKEFEVDFAYFVEESKLKQVNKDNATGYIADTQIFNISEKLIEQYELRLNEKEETINYLKNKLLNLESK